MPGEVEEEVAAASILACPHACPCLVACPPSDPTALLHWPPPKPPHAPPSPLQLLCSDGIWNSMKEKVVLRFVKQRLSSGRSPAEVCSDLCKGEG